MSFWSYTKTTTFLETPELLALRSENEKLKGELSLMGQRRSVLDASLALCQKEAVKTDSHVRALEAEIVCLRLQEKQLGQSLKKKEVSYDSLKDHSDKVNELGVRELNQQKARIAFLQTELAKEKGRADAADAETARIAWLVEQIRPMLRNARAMANSTETELSLAIVQLESELVRPNENPPEDSSSQEKPMPAAFPEDDPRDELLDLDTEDDDDEDDDDLDDLDDDDFWDEDDGDLDDDEDDEDDDCFFA